MQIHAPAAASPPVRQVTHPAWRMRLKWNAFCETGSKRTCKTLFTLFLGCRNDLCPVLRLVSQGRGTQVCDCTVLLLGRHFVIVILSSAAPPPHTHTVSIPDDGVPIPIWLVNAESAELDTAWAVFPRCVWPYWGQCSCSRRSLAAPPPLPQVVPPTPCENNALVTATVGVVSVKFCDLGIAVARGGRPSRTGLNEAQRG